MQPPTKDIGIAWKPSWKHVPWIAFVSILGFVVCCVGLATILFTSDGRDVTAWPYQSRTIPVSVLLSLVVSLANLCLAVALHTGYEISWWTQALKGAEVRKLQFDLDIQRRISAIFGQNLSIDKFAIAAVVSLAVSIVDGPLIQRASSVSIKELGPSSIGANVDVLNATFPANFSTVSGGFPHSYLFTPLFSNVSRAYANRDDIMLPIEECMTNTTCVLTLPAPGFDVSCTEQLLPYDLANLSAGGTGNQISNPSPNGIDKEATAFNVSIRGEEDYSTINTTAMYKSKATRMGDLIQRECVLRLATVGYPITVNDGVVSLKRWQLGQNHTIKLTPSSSLSSSTPLIGSIYRTGTFDNVQTMLGGFFYVLDSLYTSYAVLRQGEDIHPTADIVNTARELMLRSAIAYSDFNRTAVMRQELMVQRTEVLSAYKSDYMYLAITLACMVLQALIIAFLLFGWHRLGREVSLDAFEVARALGAPLLQGGSSNSDIHKALSPLQRHKLRYGEILSAADQVQTSSHEDSTRQSYSKVGSHEGVRLIGSEAGAELQSQSGDRPKLGLGPEDQIGDLRPGVLY
ncbi:hypothetical protein MRS44_018694 [Fusarium solani]|uniref:uncharacterized protein n=1 Tax=Fusarium solani TaxID=169388 RepID=UPI0032C405EC|nr:hypothetical protein MRS44_018694 [Fusarium solani]